MMVSSEHQLTGYLWNMFSLMSAFLVCLYVCLFAIQSSVYKQESRTVRHAQQQQAGHLEEQTFSVGNLLH